MRRWVALAIAVLGCVVACDQLFAIEVRGLEPEAGALDGAVFDGSVEAGGPDARVDATLPSDGPAEADAQRPKDGAEEGDGTSGVDGAADDVSADAGPCAVVYVSADGGSDTNPGCSETAPKQTVAAGLASAQSLGAGTVEVCAGTYDENNLQIMETVQLLGGFDCQMWSRTGVPDGGPGTTILQNSNSTPTPATLTIVASAGAVDGFTIHGPTAPDGGSTSAYYAAVEAISTASAPTISDNFIVGGAGPSSSAGIVVAGGASPVIVGNSIDGGSGAPLGATANASTGILVETGSGSVTVTGNTVHGGTGTAPNATTGFGSSALWFTGDGLTSGSFTVTGNTLYGGMGSISPCTNANCWAVRPVLITGPNDIVFQGNVAQPTEPGLLVTSGANCPQTLQLSAGGSLLVANNRVYGGQCALATNMPDQNQEALNIGTYAGAGSGSVIVENNLIHAGSVDVLRFGAGVLLDAPNAVIRANTIIAPPGPENGSAIWVGSSATNSLVEGNILAGAGGTSSYGLQMECLGTGPQPLAVSFHDNLVFGAPGGLLHYNGTGAGCTISFFTIDEMNAALVSLGGSASGNVTVAAPPCTKTADGGSDLGCVAACSGGDAGCFETLFFGWDNASYGVKDLFNAPVFDGGCPAVPIPSGDGWPLVTTGGVPCQILRSAHFDASFPPSDGGEAGAFTDAGTLSQDFYGNCRATLPSMGAGEAPQDAACLPP